MNNNNLSNKNLVKEFEDSFSALIGLLANTNCQQSTETDELKLSVEQCAQKFIEKGKDMETFFIQKRFQLLSQKPEHLIVEDINDIKNEIARKDNLIERFNQKLEAWQQILDDNYPLPNHQPTQLNNTMLIGQNQPIMNNMQGNLQNNLQNNLQGSLQNQQLTPQHQSMPAIRQRSPIQQPIIQQNMPTGIHNTGLRQQHMSPHHSYQSYTPQLPNQSPMMNMQHSPAMSQGSPQMHSIQQPTNYAPTNQQQQQSHLAFLEQQVEKTTSNFR